MHLLLINCAGEGGGWLDERLGGSGFMLRRAGSTGEALRHRMTDGTAAVLIDSGAQAPEASQLVRPLRSGGVEQPILMLSPRAGWREKVACLDAGADDYLVKPVRSEEVAARLRAVIRRSAGATSGRVRLGGFELDLNARCAWMGGRCLDLTRNEFRLMRLFMLEPDRIHTHAEIRERLHGVAAMPTLNAVEVQVTRLRRKLGRAAIRTVRGVGYRIMSQEAQGEAVEEECCKRASCDGSAAQDGGPAQDDRVSHDYCI